MGQTLGRTSVAFRVLPCFEKWLFAVKETFSSIAANLVTLVMGYFLEDNKSLSWTSRTSPILMLCL